MSASPSLRRKHDLLTGFDVRIVRDSKIATLFVLALAVFACVPAWAGQKPAAGATAAAAKPLITKSPDGIKIVSDVTGAGTAVMLLHGGGQTRKSWSERGYVERLSRRFRVIAVDLRGSGESDKPATAAAYELDRVLADLLAVADAAGVKRFHVWGFGHGATIGRYLAARSDRVMSLVLAGADMGPALSGIVKDALTGMRAKWQPLLDAQKSGTLDVKALSPGDRSAWDGGIATSSLALWALLDYPPLEPADLRVPTLWVVGAADQTAMANVKEYEGKLGGTKVTLATLSGASYSDSFAKIDVVMEKVEPFLASVGEKS